MGKSLFVPPPPPPPSRQRKTFCAIPRLLFRNFLRPPFIMAKILSYFIKTTPTLFVTPLPPPPFSMAQTFSAPPLFIGLKLHWLPSCFVAPPPFPVISDQSLMHGSCQMFAFGIFMLLFCISNEAGTVSARTFICIALQLCISSNINMDKASIC